MKLEAIPVSEKQHVSDYNSGKTHKVQTSVCLIFSRYFTTLNMISAGNSYLNTRSSRTN